VEQGRSTSVSRQTCNRIKVGKVWKKSECEKEKARRYQKIYRGNNPVSGISKSVQGVSVAPSNVNHLTKHKGKKYKRRCLKCGNKFTGVGAYNRICGHCTVENTRIKLL
jgi:hypothetical protein